MRVWEGRWKGGRERERERESEERERVRGRERERKVARDFQRYNQRHDAVFQEIANCIRPKLSPTIQLTANLNDEYEFPTHIVPTDLRPDIVWWDDSRNLLCLLN